MTVVDLGISGDRLRDVARTLKQGFDDLQETDSGWWAINFEHPVWGREPAASAAERVPGNIVASSDEPGPEADVLIVVVGYADSFTGEVHLGNGMVVASTPAEEDPEREDDEDSRYPDRWLPAVALFEEGGVKALIGSVHHTDESAFETVSLGPEVDGAIREWLEEVAAGRDPAGRISPA